MKTIIFRLLISIMLLSFLLIALAMGIGNQQSGEHVAAFTANTYKTHSMYVSDSGYGLNFYIEFSGHENELPVWSAQVHGVVFYPCNQRSEPSNKLENSLCDLQFIPNIINIRLYGLLSRFL